jgi:HAD superfamily hydrolase (TIGR01509 family)
MDPTSARHARPLSRAHPLLAGVLFDLDGTLTKQGAIDFDGIRAEIGVPGGVDGPFILEFMEGLDPEARFRAEEIVVRREMEAAERSEPNDGAEEAVATLRSVGLAVGIVTRNTRAALEAALGRFPTLRPRDFDVIVTRDDGLRIKPAPDMLLHAARAMESPIERTMMVGDFRLDVEAGNAAGAITVYLWDPANSDEAPPPESDAVITTLRDLPALIESAMMPR